MLLLSCEDENHKELQTRANRIRCRPEDMVTVPNMGATFRLPNRFFPAAASELAEFFYDQQVRLSLPFEPPCLTRHQARENL